MSSSDASKPKVDKFQQLLSKGYGQFIFPSVLALGHAAFLYSGYVQMVGKDNPIGSSPIPWWQPVAFVVFYLAMVNDLYISRAGRASINIDAYMFIYNIYETVLSAGA